MHAATLTVQQDGSTGTVILYGQGPYNRPHTTSAGGCIPIGCAIIQWWCVCWSLSCDTDNEFERFRL